MLVFDGLPLALDQAGAYIEETPSTLDAYLKAYQRRQTELLQERGKERQYHPTPVATTWSLNFEQVEQLNPAAADLLRFLAFLAPDAIPEDLMMLDMYNCSPLSLNDKSLIKNILDTLPQALGMHKLTEPVVVFTEGNDKKDPAGLRATPQVMHLVLP